MICFLTTSHPATPISALPYGKPSSTNPGLPHGAWLRPIACASSCASVPSAAADGTLAQELAHAMGRNHAPCGNPGFVDEGFPYGNAEIGVAGWDVVKKQIIDPDARRYDFMSYCGPVWTSDYTWSGIHSWMQDVAAEKHEADAKRIHVDQTVRAFH